MFNNLVSWSSRKQSIVTLSSTESEFVAVCITCCELLHIKNLLADLSVNCNLPITLFEDNQSTIKLLQSFANNKRCKHIDVKFHFVLDLNTQGIVNIQYVCTGAVALDRLYHLVNIYKPYNVSYRFAKSRDGFADIKSKKKKKLLCEPNIERAEEGF